jgi:hypothetical protein
MRVAVEVKRGFAMRNDTRIVHAVYHCLEIAEGASDILLELPPESGRIGGDSPIEYETSEDERKHYVLRITEFQKCLIDKSVELANTAFSTWVDSFVDSANRLKKILLPPDYWERFGEYPEMVRDFMELTVRFRIVVDEHLARRDFQRWLYHTLSPVLGSGTTKNSKTQLFEQRLKNAVMFILERKPNGVSGESVARAIGVHVGTFRKSYAPLLKARYGVQNDGDGYFIRDKPRITWGEGDF